MWNVRQHCVFFHHKGEQTTRRRGANRGAHMKGSAAQARLHCCLCCLHTAAPLHTKVATREEQAQQGDTARREHAGPRRRAEERRQAEHLEERGRQRTEDSRLIPGSSSGRPWLALSASLPCGSASCRLPPPCPLAPPLPPPPLPPPWLPTQVWLQRRPSSWQGPAPS